MRSLLLTIALLVAFLSKIAVADIEYLDHIRPRLFPHSISLDHSRRPYRSQQSDSLSHPATDDNVEPPDSSIAPGRLQSRRECLARPNSRCSISSGSEKRLHSCLRMRSDSLHRARLPASST
ncbi:hypothetical protein B0J11DRAFT_240140 [Dendryphion nanum]|uniref:Uncharacterized protein n=1 Tax=Dendryphion nanum TaxID=256645 RepID=A0A9P9CXF2_9PLEO|nr:hypothetical protein B0J11DRAFT_240140 [Dendryphion nanum]